MIQLQLRRVAAALAFAAVLFVSAGTPVVSAEAPYRTKVVEGDFESVAFGLTNAIINHGLKIEHTGHVSAMLERTKGATGGGSPYIDGRYYIFCSAKLSQATMDAHQDNIAACPYTVFAYELKSAPGKTVIGYRRPSGHGDAASAKAFGAIEALLGSIIDEAGS